MNQVKSLSQKSKRINSKEPEELEKKTIKVVEAMLKKEIDLEDIILVTNKTAEEIKEIERNLFK